MIRTVAISALLASAACSNSDGAEGPSSGVASSTTAPKPGGPSFSADLARELGAGSAAGSGARVAANDTAKPADAKAAPAPGDAKAATGSAGDAKAVGDARPGDAKAAPVAADTKPADVKAVATTDAKPADAKAPVGDAKAPVGDAKAPVGDAKGVVAKAPVGDAKAPVGDAKAPVGDAKAPVGDAKGVVAKAPVGDAKAPVGDTKAPVAPATAKPTDTKPAATPAVAAPAKASGDLAAIKLSLLPNWDRDIGEAGTFQYVVRIKGTQSTKTFLFRYGYDDPKAPTERDEYKKYLQETRQLTGELKDRQRGSAWFLEGADASGSPAFRYQVMYGGKRLVCYGSLYKDAESSRLGDDRDQTLIQAKQICETLAL